jgi:hypothetical protein
MTGSVILKECKGMHPKTKHTSVRPHEMYKVDIAVLATDTRVNADTP